MDRRWMFRRGCTASHIDKRYGAYIGRELFGGHGEHYGYPRYRFGLYICFGHNTWFAGMSNEKRRVRDQIEAQNIERGE